MVRVVRQRAAAACSNSNGELSKAIAEPIRLRLSPERLTALGRRQSRSPEAYDLCLRGRHLWNQLTPPTNRRAVEHFARATELDPEYSLAWSGLADAFSASPINADVRPLDVWPRARDATAHAVSSGPDIAESRTSQGMVYYWLDWNWPGSEAAYRKALVLDPNNARAYCMLGVLLGTAGRHTEARAAMRRARELDPLQPINHALSGVSRYWPGLSAGLEFARHATVVGPAFSIGYFQLAWAHERLGNMDLALEALKDAETFASGNSKMISLRGSSWRCRAAAVRQQRSSAPWRRLLMIAMFRPMRSLSYAPDLNNASER